MRRTWASHVQNMHSRHRKYGRRYFINPAEFMRFFICCIYKYSCHVDTGVILTINGCFSKRKNVFCLNHQSSFGCASDMSKLNSSLAKVIRNSA